MAEEKSTTTTTEIKVENGGKSKKTTTKKTTVTKKDSTPTKSVESVEVKEVVTEPVATKEAEEIKNETKVVSEDKPTKNRILKKMEIDDDAKQNRKFAWLAYILFFIPLCINNKSSYMRFHANEGLEINIIDAISIVFLLLGVLCNPINTWVQGLLIAFTIVSIGALVLTTVTKIYMICVSAIGIRQETPWLSDIKIIK